MDAPFKKKARFSDSEIEVLRNEVDQRKSILWLIYQAHYLNV